MSTFLLWKLNEKRISNLDSEKLFINKYRKIVESNPVPSNCVQLQKVFKRFADKPESSLTNLQLGTGLSLVKFIGA